MNIPTIQTAPVLFLEFVGDSVESMEEQRRAEGLIRELLEVRR
jgi:hypothetical protein